MGLVEGHEEVVGIHGVGRMDQMVAGVELLCCSRLIATNIHKSRPSTLSLQRHG